MPRTVRTDIGGHIYHVINRANARVQIFDTDADYKQFETVLEEATERVGMRILAYCIMPNHWHLILHPVHDGDLQKFMGWLSMTHTQRWHAAKGTIGQGHLYQGRYKSFVCQEDKHFITLVRYVERNAKRAGLVSRAESWKWSSVWRRERGTAAQKKLLSHWPVSIPTNYLTLLNEPQTPAEEESVRTSIIRGNPFGGNTWMERAIKKFGLESTVRRKGRPKKGS